MSNEQQPRCPEPPKPPCVHGYTGFCSQCLEKNPLVKAYLNPPEEIYTGELNDLRAIAARVCCIIEDEQRLREVVHDWRSKCIEATSVSEGTGDGK